MPRIRFEPAGYEIDVAPGERIVDVTDAHPKARVPYSCRTASCGTCRVEVLEGPTGLEPPEHEEREILEIFGDPPAVRLACQAVVGPHEGRIVLRVMDPD